MLFRLFRQIYRQSYFGFHFSDFPVLLYITSQIDAHSHLVYHNDPFCQPSEQENAPLPKERGCTLCQCTQIHGGVGIEVQSGTAARQILVVALRADHSAVISAPSQRR